MSDEDLNIIRAEIRDAFRQNSENSIKEFCKVIGIDINSDTDEISQNKADKIIGRAARTEGKLNKTIRYKNIKAGKLGRIILSREDVMKIKNKNKFK
jgi:hypothetical protein